MSGRDGSSGPRAHRARPAVTLLLLAPVLGELVSGHQSPLEFLNPITFTVLALPYGFGALLCRELWVRWGGGWQRLLLLALAYAIYEEGLVARSVWDPEWAELGVIGAYSFRGGVTWTWAAALLHFHVTVSIGASVIVAHLIHPGHRHEPWLTSRQLAWCAIGLAAWMPALMVLHPFVPSVGAWLAATIGIAGLAIVAYRLPASRPRPDGGRPVPSLWYGLVTAASTTLVFLVVFALPEWSPSWLPPWPVSLAVVVAVDAASAWWVLRWSRGGRAMDDRRKLALVGGVLVFYLAFNVAQDLEGPFTGRSVVAALCAAGLWWLGRAIDERARGPNPQRAAPAKEALHQSGGGSRRPRQ
jgi:hypothetical protein